LKKYCQGETGVLGEKPVPLPRFQPQILYIEISVRNWATR